MNQLAVHQSDAYSFPIPTNFTPLISSPKQWFYALAVIGSLVSVVTPHPPFLALAVVAAASLTPRRASLSLGAFWFVHLVSNYAFRGLHFTVTTLLWELILALSIGFVLKITIAIASYASSNDPVRGRSVWDWWLVFTTALGLGFVVFEGLQVLFWVGLGGHGYTPAVMGYLLLQSSLWTFGLAGLRAGLELFRFRALNQSCCVL